MSDKVGRVDLRIEGGEERWSIFLWGQERKRESRPKSAYVMRDCPGRTYTYCPKIDMDAAHKANEMRWTCTHTSDQTPTREKDEINTAKNRHTTPFGLVWFGLVWPSTSTQPPLVPPSHHRPHCSYHLLPLPQRCCPRGPKTLHRLHTCSLDVCKGPVV